MNINRHFAIAKTYNKIMVLSINTFVWYAIIMVKVPSEEVIRMSAGRIRVAVATDDGITSDVYFGRANRFVLAEIDGNKIIREGEILTENQHHPSNSSGCNGHDREYIEGLVKKLNECSYLIVKHIGNFPFRILKSNGINVLEQTGDIDDLLKRMSVYVTR